MQGRGRSAVVLGTGAAALLAAWLLVPRPSLEEPCGGPRWYRHLWHTFMHIQMACAEHAETHGGIYPDTLAELLPHSLFACPDPVLGKRAWDARRLWRPVRWVLCGAIAAWTLALLLRRRRALALVPAVAATALAAALTATIIHTKAPPPYTYSHLRYYRVLPGVRDPIPPEVPVVWLTSDFPIEHLRRHYLLRDGAWCSPDYLRPLDLGSLERLLAAPASEVLARARAGNASACLALAVRKEPKAADLLSEAKPEAKTHRIALWGLYMLGDAQAGPLTLKALASPDESTRSYAAQLLRHLRTKGATQALIPLLPDEPRRWSPDVVASLGCDGDLAALPYLERALATPRLPRTTKTAACGALARMGSPNALDLLLRVVDGADDEWSRAALIQTLGEAGAAAVPALSRFLASKRVREREAAIRALGRTGSREAIEPLLSALGPPQDTHLVAQALADLGQPGKDRLLAHASGLLAEHPHINERSLAATLLGYTGSPAAVPLLLRLLNDPTSVARVDAIRSLGRLRATAAVPPLIQRLKDPSEHCREAAAATLADIGDRRALPGLRRAARVEGAGPADHSAIQFALRRLAAYVRYLDAEGKPPAPSNQPTTP